MGASLSTSLSVVRARISPSLPSLSLHLSEAEKIQYMLLSASSFPREELPEDAKVDMPKIIVIMITFSYWEITN